MIRPTRAVVFGAALAFSVLSLPFGSAPHAAAQWLPDRAYTEGPGIRLGDVELHPGIAVRGGYDTNIFRTPGGPGDLKELGSAILAITPHLNLTSLGRQRRTQGEDAAGAGAAPLPPPVAFNLGTALTYFHYFQNRGPKNLEVDFDGNVSILPERTFGFDVGASYARNSRPFTARIEGNNVYAFDRVRPSLLLRGQSRGGVLRAGVGFAPTITLYEGFPFKYLSLYQFDIPANISWKFLPNTALLFDGAAGFNQYKNDPTKDTAITDRASIFVSDSKRFQTRLGINGAVTPRFGIRALVGYAAVLLDRGELHDHEDAVGEAALTFAWSPKDNLEAGYQRLVDLSNLGGWTQLDRGYLKSSMLFGGLFALNLEAGVAGVNYGRMLNVNGGAIGVGNDTSREDIRVDAGIHAEVRATNWLAFMVDFSTLHTFTDFEYDRSRLDNPNTAVDESQQNVVPFPAEFSTYQIYGGVRAHY